jgi:chromate transporter
LLSTQSTELLNWLHGLKLVAVAIVAQAIWGMQKQLCTTTTTRLITLISAGSLLAFQWQFMQLIVIAGGLIAGLLFCSSLQHDGKESPSIADQHPNSSTRVFSAVLLGVFTIGLVVLPLLATQSNEFVSMFDRFYRSGALVFGGGHVVLPLLFNEFVPPGLVGETDFFIGYGAAQALPGPLFTFATFLGAASIVPNALIAAVVATIAIFLPGMLLLFAVLPYWHSVNQNILVKRALIGINAAVVGLLLAALIDPIVTTAISTVTDIAIVLVALFALIRFKLHPLWAIVGCLVSHGFVLII